MTTKKLARKGMAAAKPAPMTRAEIAEVFDELVAGGKSLSKLLTTPARVRRFFVGIIEDPALAKEFELVQQSTAHKMALEIVDIADNEPDPARAKVRCDVRIRLLEKFHPGVYGQKLSVDVCQRIDLVGILDRRQKREDEAIETTAVPVPDPQVQPPDPAPPAQLPAEYGPGPLQNEARLYFDKDPRRP